VRFYFNRKTIKKIFDRIFHRDKVVCQVEYIVIEMWFFEIVI